MISNRATTLAGLFVIAASLAVCGKIITRDTRWKPDTGPVYLFTDVVVARGASLTIAPGTRIIIGRPRGVDTTIRQYDEIDAKTISIKVHGTLIAEGIRSKRIIFSPDTSNKDGAPYWYGIILQEADNQFTEIANVDITGAYCGVTIDECAPVIRNSIIEYNHIGINCRNRAAPRIRNCTIVSNMAVGIGTSTSNPVITGNIIAFNRNNGIWCDGTAKISCTFNCIAENGDGNFLDCDPELGVKVKTGVRGDSVDMFNNRFTDPVFIGSPAERKKQEQDVTLPTEKGLIKDSLIASIINLGRKPTAKTEEPPATGRYQLSKYSPCIDAGDPDAGFKDPDGSRNDIGNRGGPDFISKK
jgi:hypothetical protein